MSFSTLNGITGITNAPSGSLPKFASEGRLFGHCGTYSEIVKAVSEYVPCGKWNFLKFDKLLIYVM